MNFAPFSYRQVPTVASAPAGVTYSVRTDPSASFVRLAMPYANFSELGMNSYTASIDGLIRDNNINNSYQMKSTGSGGTFMYPSASVVSYSSSLWGDQGYTSSLSLQNAQNPGVWMNQLSSSNFVVEFWMNVQAASFGMPPFQGHILGGSGGNYLTIQYNFGNVFRWFINGANSWTTTPNFNFGGSNTNWKHFAFSKSGTTVRVYMNGTKIGEGTRAASINTNDLAPLDGLEIRGGYWVLGTTSNNDGLFRLIQDYRLYQGTDKGYTGNTITVPSSIVIKN